MTGYDPGGAGVYACGGIDRRIPAGRVDRDVNSADKSTGSRTLPDFCFCAERGISQNGVERRKICRNAQKEVPEVRER